MPLHPVQGESYTAVLAREGPERKEGVMPKEVILDHEFDSDSCRGLRTEIRWSRDAEHVQLATVADGPPPAGGLGAEGWFVSLDRRKINDLIRHLRRARDQAFGRDE
jgi:hypothetical protein